MTEYEDEDARTLFCANLSDKVTEALLYELFLQGGPVEKVAQPKDKDGRARTFAFITYVHAVSVPYAVTLFQGTQLFNRELTIKPRNNNSNNNNANVQQRVDNLMPQLTHPQLPHPQLLQLNTMRNPFETISKFGNDGSGRLDRIRENVKAHETQYEQSSLRSGFMPIATKASMQMQPQPTHRSNNQPPANALNLNDLNKLIALGSNMLQSSSRPIDIPTRPTYDMLFADRDGSDRHSSNLKMTNRHNSRSHYRDEPYAPRDPPRHRKRRSADRRRR